MSLSAESRLRDQIRDLARPLFDRGLTHGGTGNISPRTEDGGLLVSPKGTGFGRVDPARRQIAGDPPTRGMAVHSAPHDSRSKAGVVVRSISPRVLTGAQINAVVTAVTCSGWDEVLRQPRVL